MSGGIRPKRDFNKHQEDMVKVGLQQTLDTNTQSPESMQPTTSDNASKDTNTQNTSCDIKDCIDSTHQNLKGCEYHCGECCYRGDIKKMQKHWLQAKHPLHSLYLEETPHEKCQGKDIVRPNGKVSQPAVCEGCGEEEKNCTGVYMECIKERGEA